MADAYRAEQARLHADNRADRAELMDTVLHGPVLDRWTAWEAAELLQLPTTGPFVVLAAEVVAVGTEALPERRAASNSESLLQSAPRDNTCEYAVPVSSPPWVLLRRSPV